MKIYYFLSCFLLSSLLLQAQEMPEAEDIITDRPDETEAPSLVEKGFLQVETGFFFERLENDQFFEETWGYNTTLLRYGLLKNMEIRVGFDLVKLKESLKENETEFSTGLRPLLMGAKIGIAEEKGDLPQMGLIGHIYLPFAAAEEYKPETTGVDFRFAFSHSFSSSDLSYNLGAKWRDDNPEATFIYTLAYGFDINDKLGVFAELYGDIPEKKTAEHQWDAGFTFLVKPNIQLDGFIGTGINTDHKITAGGGISFRLPR